MLSTIESVGSPLSTSGAPCFSSTSSSSLKAVFVEPYHRYASTRRLPCVPPGSGNRTALDRDEDALVNGVETGTGVFVSASDTGSDPTLADTDGDGFDDGLEVQFGSDPNNANSLPNLQVPALSPWGVLLLALGLALTGALGRQRIGRRSSAFPSR